MHYLVYWIIKNVMFIIKTLLVKEFFCLLFNKAELIKSKGKIEIQEKLASRRKFHASSGNGL